MIQSWANEDEEWELQEELVLLQPMMKWDILLFNTDLFSGKCSALLKQFIVHGGTFISMGVLVCTQLGEILLTNPLSSALDISVNFRISLQAWVLDQRQSFQ